jgi:hypothetical protein
MLVLAACGSSPGTGGGGDGAGQKALAEDLTFTGELSAHLTSATGLCIVTTAKDFDASLFGKVGGQAFTFLLVVDHPVWHGAASYPARQDLAPNLSINTAQVTTGSAIYTSLNSTGTVTVASDLKSGTIDMGLTRFGAVGEAAAHVSGHWRCG